MRDIIALAISDKTLLPTTKPKTEVQMNKLILKTASVTVAVLLFVCIVAYGFLSLFAPLSLSEFYSDAGIYGLAYKYAVRAYEKDETQDNLINVVGRAIEAEKEDGVADYCELLLERKDLSLSDEELRFFQNKYCLALYNTGEESKAVKKAAEYSEGYPKGNALEGLAVAALEKNDVKLLNDVLGNLKVIRDLPGISEESASRLNKQIGIIENFLSEPKE